ASMPFMMGMARSITTTSGASVSAMRSVSRPSAASAMTIMSDSRSSMARMPSRTTVWSSASNIRIGFMALFSIQFGYRQDRLHGCAAAGLGADIQAPSQTPDALFHTEDAKAAYETGVKTGSVILHGNVDGIALFAHSHFHSSRTGMADGIVHRLLDQTVNASP